MQKSIKKVFKEKKGYTVLELIMVITVIAVLATITAVGIYGYLKSAYSLKANQTAKTVFYATQNYLVDQKEKGALDTFNKQAKKAGAKLSLESDIEAMLKENGFTEEQIEKFDKNHKTSKFRYLYLDGAEVSDVREVSDKKSDDYNVFYTEVLEPYIKDTNITDNSFLVEYDSATGVVMSVFYSEKIDGFVNGKNPYDTQTEERYNVVQRKGEFLSKKWQGYYGIYDTNLSSESVRMNVPEVRLVNGERLILEWQDTNKLNEEFIRNPELKNKLFFEVEITSVNRTGGSAPVTKIQKIKAGAGVPSSWDQEADMHDKEGEPIFIYYTDEETGQGTYELLLDCLHHSILKNYPDFMASDMLQCTVTARLEDITTTDGVTVSNRESANFGGGAETTRYLDKEVNVGGSGNFDENGERGTEILGFQTGTDLSYTINNARHFNNMRNVLAKKHFVQTGNVNWSTLEGKENKKLFETLIFTTKEEAKLKPGDYSVALFEGSYRVKDNHKIIGLDIKSTAPDKGENVGIFAINGGEISGINLQASKITGVSKVGSIVGTNNKAGIIRDITADATVSGVYPDKSGTKVENNYASDIGGIIGVNKGTAEKLTTGERVVSGRKNVGGVIGNNESSAEAKLLANGNTINVLATAVNGWENFGGISGRNSAESILIDCTNSGLLLLNNTGKYTEMNQPKYIGGITGYNEGKITSCINQGDKQDIDVKTDACIASLNRENGTLPQHYGIFVGGIAGGNIGQKAQIQTSSLKNAYVTGYSIVGGIAGVNWNATIKEVDKNYSDASGLIIATRHLVGGIVGYTDANLQKFSNSASVFGDSMVGGITGFHGSKFTTLGEMEAYDWDEQFEGKTEGTIAYYEALFEGADTNILRPDDNKQINQCSNDGFVYAKTRYSGGIAGINWGKINNSYSSMDLEHSKFVYEENEMLRKADCVGGIVGLNDGDLIAGSIVKTDSIVYGKSFAGGVVGCNMASIKGYEIVAGSVFGSGNYVGGFLGLNNFDEIVKSTLEKVGNGTITGKNYVGGLIGCNILDSKDSGESVKIKANTSVGTEVIGEAYAGGIIGYHTIQQGGEDLAKSCSDLYARNPYVSYDMDVQKTNRESSLETLMNDCTNGASVSGFRYVGGIIGFNEENSVLKIHGSKNSGNLEIDTERMAASGVSVEEDTVHTEGESGTSYFIGGITGRNTSTGEIKKCFSGGVVRSPSRYLGGLCEINEGTIVECTIGSDKSYASNIDGDNSVGGLVGLNHTVTNKDAEIVDCVANAYASISGGTNTGGLVGTNKAVVKDCTSFANVTAKGDNVGGIAGLNGGALNNNQIGSSTYSPNISGRTNVGGFVGNNQGNLGDKGIIQKLDNYANVKGENQVGGIVGIHNASMIKDCRNFGTIEATGTGTNGCAGGITGINGSKKQIEASYNYGTVISKNSKAGGIVGWNQGTLTKCVNEGSVSGSYQGNGEDAVGGITGTNALSAVITDCVSRSNSSGKNSINGAVIVGGIVGQNKGMVTSTDSDYQSVTIRIEITQKPMNSDNTENITSDSYIGGIIGFDGNNETTRTNQKKLSGFTFAGTINVLEAASRRQYIGGIIGLLGREYTIEQCEFVGKITGSGNTPANINDGGVGAIAGSSSGSIILSSVDTNEDVKRYGVSKTVSAIPSVVEGKTNVGGIVGLIKNQYSKILCEGNKSSDATNRITNYSTVRGVKDVGGIVGRASSSLTYSYLYNKGTVAGTELVGGILGVQTQPNALGTELVNEKEGTILAIPDSTGKASSLGGIVGSSVFNLVNCKNEGTLGEYETERGNGNITQVGGIVGNAGNSKIERCYNGGNIYLGNRNVGGIAGFGSGVTIKSCENLEEGYIDAASSVSGGIIGYISGASVNVIEDCENKGRVRLQDFKNSSGGDVQIGGIIGQIFENNSNHMTNIIKCRNSGTVRIELTSSYTKFASAGGIAGFLWNRINVTECVNSGTVDAGISGKAGGIIGRFKTIGAPEGGVNNSISNNVNAAEGKVSAKKDSGGIVGYHESYDSLDFKDNWNKGTVSGNSFVGGIIGNMYNYVANTKSGSISGGGNEGTIEVKKIGLNSVDDPGSIGGCFGNSTSQGIEITDVKNSGTIKLDSSITKIKNIGGIIGFSTANILESCENSATINLESSNAVITNLGGIAGGMTSGSTTTATLEECINKGSIVGKNTTNTGGIIGELNNGLILACSNIGSTEKIEGRAKVGGIVGLILGTNSKVMGLVTTNGTLATYNEQTITGTDIIGGIAGEQNRSVFYSVYNAGDVLLNTNKNAAGGIIGLSLSTTESENTGLLINCYNFGTIGFTDKVSVPENTISGFIGGLVGFRENDKAIYSGNKMAVSNKNTCTSTVIKDSYHVKDKTRKTQPALQMEGTKIDADKWAIGNEPFKKFLTKNNDSQSSDIEKTGRFEWSKDTFENMLTAIQLEGEATWSEEDPLANIQFMLDHYVYQLPVPIGTNITGVEGHTYNMQWASQVGLNSGIEVSVYDQNYSKEELETAKELFKFDVSEQTTEGVNINIPDDIAKQYMGKTFYIATQAFGYSVENINVTLTSEKEIVQSFVLMPPLPAPTCEIEQTLGSLEVTLTINNISTYLRKPNEDYPVLGELKVNDIYSAYKNGAYRIVIYDYFRNSETDIEVTHKMKEYEIKAENIDWETDTAVISIDYSKPENQIENRLYHTYRIQMAISEEDSKKSLEPGENLEYRYLSSVKAEYRFQIKTTSLLQTPEEFTYIYTGDLLDPSFKISWKNPKANEKKTKGYEIVVTNPVNKKEKKIIVEGESNTSCELTKDDVKNLVSGFEYDGVEKTLTYTVKALSSHDDIKDSLRSAPAEIKVPQKQKSVEDFSIIINEPDFYPERIIIEWKDKAPEVLDTHYRVSLKIDNRDAAEYGVAYEQETKNTVCGFTLPRNLMIDKDTVVEITVTKTGNISSSLDSNAAVYSGTVYKRLPAFTVAIAGNVAILPDNPNKVGCEITWTLPDGIDETNCSGFLISVLPTREADMSKAESVRIYDIAVTSTKLEFDISNLGDEMLLYIYACGREGVSSTSTFYQFAEVKLSSDRVGQSSDLSVELYDATGMPVGETCDETTIQNLECKLKWTNPNQAEYNIKGHRLMLTDENGKIISIRNEDGDNRFIDLDELLTEYSVNVDLSLYQGKTLTWSVINIPRDSGKLSSLPTETGFKVPTVLVAVPTE